MLPGTILDWDCPFRLTIEDGVPTCGDCDEVDGPKTHTAIGLCKLASAPRIHGPLLCDRTDRCKCGATEFSQSAGAKPWDALARACAETAGVVDRFRRALVHWNRQLSAVSSMVEQAAVNRLVRGSSPRRGAIV